LRNTGQSREPEKEKKFRARPMPKFNKVSIPVVGRNRINLRSPPSNQKEETHQGFRAKGLPKYLSKPSSIPVRKRDPTKLRSPDYVKTSPEYTMKKNGDTNRLTVSQESRIFQAKPAPLRSPPNIPVHDRDPTILRNFPSSPSTLPERELPAPPSLVGSSVASSASSLQPRVDKKWAVRDNVRRRMRGKTGTKQSAESFSTDDSSGIGTSMASSGESPSAYDYSTARTKGTRDSTELHGAMSGWLCDAVSTKPRTGNAPSKLHKVPQREEAPSDPQLKPEPKTPVLKGARGSAELHEAMDGWLCDAVSTTPITGNAQAKLYKKPKSQKKTDKMSETRRLEQEAFMVHDPDEFLQGQTRSQLYEETTRLAADLQRAVEDELSFEASLNSKDNLDEGFIGQPTSGQFSL
jgi:hypothetical protein